MQRIVNSQLQTLPPALQWLDWLAHMGIDEAISDLPIDRFAQTQNQSKRIDIAAFNAKPATPISSPPATIVGSPPVANVRSVVNSRGIAESRGVAESKEQAMNCQSLDELYSLVDKFSLCDLQKTKLNTVLATEKPTLTKVMIISGAPDDEEDRLGKAMVGDRGKFLDQQLKAIGLDRHQDCYITRAIYWRPPGNRAPHANEIAICSSFLMRQIELVEPLVLMVMGSIATTMLMGRQTLPQNQQLQWQTITTTGNRQNYSAIFAHDLDLIAKNPMQKKQLWRQWLSIKIKLNSLSNSNGE